MDKQTLRREVRALPGPTGGSPSSVVEALFDFLAPRLPGTIGGYLAMDDEVDIGELFTRLPGWQWVLPRVEIDGSLTLRDRAVDRETHRWGMSQPIDSGPALPPRLLDVLLVPGLAFDVSGGRLGRGGGHYDRLISDCRPDCAIVGVTWEERVVAAIPMEPHDRRVGWLATGTGVRECAPTR